MCEIAYCWLLDSPEKSCFRYSDYTRRSAGAFTYRVCIEDLEKLNHRRWIFWAWRNILRGKWNLPLRNLRNDSRRNGKCPFKKNIFTILLNEFYFFLRFIVHISIFCTKTYHIFNQFHKSSTYNVRMHYLFGVFHYYGTKRKLLSYIRQQKTENIRFDKGFIVMKP